MGPRHEPFAGIPLALRGLAVALATMLTAVMVTSSEPEVAGRLSTLLGDKVVHALAFGGIAALLWTARGGGPTRAVFAAVLGLALLHEASQLFVPDREATLGDLLADAAGAAAALLVLRSLSGPPPVAGARAALTPQGG